MDQKGNKYNNAAVSLVVPYYYIWEVKILEIIQESKYNVYSYY